MLQGSSRRATPEVVRGHRIDGRAPGETRRFAAGRTCAADRCATRLSAYNPSRYCWLHESPHPYYVRADRHRPSDGEPSVARPGDLRHLLQGA